MLIAICVLVMVCGLISISLSWTIVWFFALITSLPIGIVGIVLSLIGKHLAKKENASPAIFTALRIGLYMNIAGLVLIAVFAVYFFNFYSING